MLSGRISSSTAAISASTRRAPLMTSPLPAAARRPARALPLSARESRHRRQPDPVRAGARACRHRAGAAGLSRYRRRRPLALRRRRLVFCRAQLAADEFGATPARPSNGIGSPPSWRRRRQAGGAVPAQAAVSEPARDPELAASAIRYIPPPARRRLLEMLAIADVRLVASGHVHQRRDYTADGIRHVWAPSAGFIISDQRQERIGLKEVGLVEYRFQPDSFEVRHVRAPGQVDIDLDSAASRRRTDARVRPCPARPAPAACRNWRLSIGP